MVDITNKSAGFLGNFIEEYYKGNPAGENLTRSNCWFDDKADGWFLVRHLPINLLRSSLIDHIKWNDFIKKLSEEFEDSTFFFGKHPRTNNEVIGVFVPNQLTRTLHSKWKKVFD